MEFKDVLRNLRKEKGVGQVELANAIGVSKGVISFWETGRNEPTLQALKKLSKYFGVSIDYLAGLED
jgi:transcriptional regulator with XRE-family HTH domain